MPLAKDQIITGGDFSLVAFNTLMHAFKVARSLPNVVLPTGNTPKPLYKKMREQRNLVPAFSYVNLDEYKGIDWDDPRSYVREIMHEVLDPLDLDFNPELAFNGEAFNAGEECARIANNLKSAGGIDICVLGIGENGHIGFNEPSRIQWDFVPAKESYLNHLTRQANASFCDPHGGVPNMAYTLGIESIMDAKQVILLTGKPEITNKALNDPITHEVPASILQEHPNLKVVATPSVAQKLRLAR